QKSAGIILVESPDEARAVGTAIAFESLRGCRLDRRNRRQQEGPQRKGRLDARSCSPLGDSPRLDRKVTDCAIRPSAARVQFSEDGRLAGQTGQFANQRGDTYAAASISISASRSAMTSSKAEIAC